MLENVRDLILQNGWHLFLASFVFFLLLYFFFAYTTFYISLRLAPARKIHAAKASPEKMKRQIRFEIRQSLVSILIFALQAIFIQLAYTKGWATINWKINGFTLLPQILILFLWNEIHFFTCHWSLHRKWFFRRVHVVHHRSLSPTPFSIYSFHWFEAFLLGTVIFPPLLLYPFQYAAILSLPLLSILLNVLGHWDYDLFPHQKPSHWTRFSFRHSMHHKWSKGNYGFFLPVFDQLFHTNLKNEQS
jgi:sterol desaturase/sphingolipid hydroxylase (fatty acid hydroxylase superfamily)